MLTTENFLLAGANKRNMLCDITYDTLNTNGKIILLLHGFKSFKDWGCWPWLSKQFAQQGYTFIKINFSHNGVGATTETCQDFIDLPAFGQNNFSKQLQDVEAMMHFINNKKHTALQNCDIQNIICIGHSMGGGMAILAAAKYASIAKLITLNSMSNFYDLLKRFNVNDWQSNGVVYVDNARTKQQMPLQYQILQDYNANKSALDIPAKSAQVKCPWLLVYATQDETILPSHALQLQKLNSNIQLCAIENTGHTFGATHPFDESNLGEMELVVEKIMEFLVAKNY